MPLIMPTPEQVYELNSRIAVMKPASPKDTPQHAKKMQQLMLSDDYAGEEKIDGCHYTMMGCYFISTDHVDKTPNFPHLQQGFTDLGFPMLILDGEINYPGKTSQYCTRVTGASTSTAIDFQKSNGYIKYTIFDILRLPNGVWVHDQPYRVRRKYIETLMRDYISQSPQLKEHVNITAMTIQNKQAFLDRILDTGAEGIVLKNLDSVYHFGKKPMWEWMKVKQHDTVDLIITGHKEPKTLYMGSQLETWQYWALVDGVQRPVTKAYYNKWPGAFQLSAYVNGELKVICYAAGLSEDIMESYTTNPDLYLGKVARIDYMEKTEDGNLRHPAFTGLHEDKQPEQCIYSYN